MSLSALEARIGVPKDAVRNGASTMVDMDTIQPLKI